MMKKQRTSRPPAKRATPEQVTALSERMSALFRENPRYGTLYDTLLEVGGETVAAVEEPDLEKLIQRGYPQSGRGAQRLKGQRSQCHANAAFAWKDHPETLGIVTGYGLSRDGIWRQHSWLRDLIDGQVFETTEPRAIYFGFDLTPEEAERFYDSNAF